MDSHTKYDSSRDKNLMAKSLLYVDFGENRRDKMLRESVSQDCCIISGKMALLYIMKT